MEIAITPVPPVLPGAIRGSTPAHDATIPWLATAERTGKPMKIVALGAVCLLILWVAALVSASDMGWWIHLLPIAAAALVVRAFVQAGRARTLAIRDAQVAERVAQGRLAKRALESRGDRR
jgi:hypothetical protein